MRVTIVICNYNYEAFLERAIESAVQQTHSDTQVVVVDDGSTDQSRAVIERWVPRVTAVFQKNAGQVSAYNTGFRHASGDIVMFLDADDFLYPSACADVVRAFDDATVKVHFRLRLVDEHGRPLGGVLPRHLSAGDVSSSLLRHGRLYQSAPGTGNAYRTSALARLMPIVEDEQDRHGADFFTIFGVSLLGAVRVAGDEPLGAYRVHRRAEVGDPSRIVFGNAAHHAREPYSSYRRYQRMRGWIRERLGPAFELPGEVFDFSLDKQGFAISVFESGTYLQGLRCGGEHFRTRMVPAIVSRPGSWTSRAALLTWAVAVLVLPRRVGLPVARFVCDPASR